MTPITKAIQDVKMRVPPQILTEAYVSRPMAFGVKVSSVDDQITSEVIRPRVLVDTNINGYGLEATIDLTSVPYEKPDNYTTVYRVPKTHTQGRSIISVLNVTYADSTLGAVSSYGAAGMYAANTPALGVMLQGVVDSNSTIPITSTAQATLIGENVVMVRDTIASAGIAYLRANLANDENLTDLPIRSYRVFSELVTLAVKSHIYNNYIVKMDLGQLYGGQMIGKFREIVEGYADAEELYGTMLKEKWTKVSIMSDRPAFTRYVRTLVGGYR